jgi:hypothetical protein
VALRTGVRRVFSRKSRLAVHAHVKTRLHISRRVGAAFVLSLQRCGASGFAATFTVTSSAGSVAVALRQAILDANANAGPNTITFNIRGGGPQTLNLGIGLPVITEPLL